MKTLILTGGSAWMFMRSAFGDLEVIFTFRFVWGPLPSPGELASYLAARSDRQAPGGHWSDFGDWRRTSRARNHLGLVEFCQDYEAIELQFDPLPNDQLQLIWLLDCLRSFPGIVARLKLRLLDHGKIASDQFVRAYPPAVDVTGDVLETASAAWQAYRAPTPESCVDLLRRDLSSLPALRPALINLMAELPSATTALGATEMEMLEMISRGHDRTSHLFHLGRPRGTRIYDEFEHGYLLDALAHGPTPAVAGLDDALRRLDRENPRARHEGHLRSWLSLTEFGKAVVERQEDFSHHNPIDRWWGGTRLTNDRLWRWDPVARALIAP